MRSPRSLAGPLKTATGNGGSARPSASPPRAKRPWTRALWATPDSRAAARRSTWASGFSSLESSTNRSDGVLRARKRS